MQKPARRHPRTHGRYGDRRRCATYRRGTIAHSQGGRVMTTARLKKPSDAENLEAILARVLRAPDPTEALTNAAANPRLSARLKRALLSCDFDGVRLTALLIAKLRFERLLRASAS